MHRNHHSLRSWQTARDVATAVQRVSDQSWRPGLAEVFQQIRKAAMSVQLNIAEGYSFQAAPRTLFHYDVAYGSAVETGDLLDTLIAQPDLDHEALAAARAANMECQRTLRGLIRWTRQRV